MHDRIAPDPRRLRREQATHLRVADTVGEVMTSPVESLTPGADIADAASIMIDERIRCLPVVDGHRIIGVVSRRDLLRAITPEPDPVSIAHRPAIHNLRPRLPLTHDRAPTTRGAPRHTAAPPRRPPCTSPRERKTPCESGTS